MEIYYTIQRPSMALLSACVPSAAARVVTGAPQAPLSRVHQVQIQAELAQILVPSMGGSNGFESGTGFGGGDGSSVKVTDEVGGAPPRGRPV